MIGKLRKHMVLTMFMHPAGYHNYSWRGPDSRAESWGSPELIVDLATRAQAAKLDAVFFADTVSASPLMSGDTKVLGVYEPISALSMLAGVTKDIGLIGTASTTFSHPYTLARQFAGIDHLSHGRAGWNIVTSWMGAEQYGLDAMPESTQRYKQAHEFVDVAKRLWESWDEDAVIADRENGWWIDPSKLHALNHSGEHYKVKGPLGMPRSPQSGPVLVQAGSSGPGVEFGATFAELVYTAQPLKGKSVEFYESYKQLVGSKGRPAEDVSIMPGIMPIIGKTRADAEDYAKELESWVDLEHARGQLQNSIGVELGDLEFDELIPAERFEDALGAAPSSRGAIFKSQALEQRLTLRQIILNSAKASGHRWVVGSASEVAETMIDWFESRACDGFSLNAPSLPEGYKRVLELLVPELQERGYFHDAYAGGTLRENLRAGR